MAEAGELVAVTYSGAVAKAVTTPALLEQTAKICLSSQIRLLAARLVLLATFNNCQTVSVGKCDINKFKNILQQSLLELSIWLVKRLKQE